MTDHEYVGNELELFAHATNWKAYFGCLLAPYIKGDVLEVGAGIGGTTRVLCTGDQRSWLCLEPDPSLVDQLARAIRENPMPIEPEVVIGCVSALDEDCQFDSILYADVLEHIEDDQGELRRAAEHLRPEGNIVALCPAHQFLFTPFDKAIGHFRRYNKRMLRSITPPGTTLCRCFYLDSTGVILSLANRFLLNSSLPTRSQIRLWDRFFVRCSRVIDPLLGWRWGKSILALWCRPHPENRWSNSAHNFHDPSAKLLR